MVDSCRCDSGWRQAGLTDTIEFLEGACTQYQCVSDERCEQTTGVAGAKCVVPGWNCLCPFEYSLKSSLLGYDTYSDVGGGGTGGRCMGLLYWISVRGSTVCADALKRGWSPFIILAFLFLPFGQRRTACTHQSPGLLNLGLWMVGFKCRGDCLERSLRHDTYALSIWAMEMCLWYHFLIVYFWATCLWVWCVAVWLMVIVILVVAAIVACVIGALGMGGSGGGNDCRCCENGCDCKCCDQVDCDVCCPTPFGGGSSFSSDLIFYTVGGNDRNCSCHPGNTNCCCFTHCCHPLAYVITLLPRFPQNLLGGAIGRLCLGTHASLGGTRNNAGPLSGLRWLLSLPWWQRDLHSDEGWRRRVRVYLSQADARSGEAPNQFRMDAPQAPRVPLLPHQCGTVRGIPVRSSPPFKLEQGCVPSTFADYEARVCWICAESRGVFDMYTCGHIFCSTCSDTMLQRRMPCPLCRKAPLSVLRASG